MKEKFRQFMIGRYGTDGLNQFLSIASIVLLLLSLLTRFSLFTWLGLALLILCYYRSLSRNISKRTEENYQYYTLKDRIDRNNSQHNHKGHNISEQYAFPCQAFRHHHFNSVACLHRLKHTCVHQFLFALRRHTHTTCRAGAACTCLNNPYMRCLPRNGQNNPFVPYLL